MTTASRKAAAALAARSAAGQIYVIDLPDGMRRAVARRNLDDQATGIGP
jgi:hypothetical protein